MGGKAQESLGVGVMGAVFEHAWERRGIIQPGLPILPHGVERHPVPGKFERVLIFTRTKHGADRVVKKLSQAGIPANAIHGNKSQPQRQRALDEFKRAKTPILVATDVAARGLDLEQVDLVINAQIADSTEIYTLFLGLNQYCSIAFIQNLTSRINFLLTCQKEQDITWWLIHMNLHHTHKRGVKIIWFWLLGIKYLYIISSARNTENFTVKEIT